MRDASGPGLRQGASTPAPGCAYCELGVTADAVAHGPPAVGAAKPASAARMDAQSFMAKSEDRIEANTDRLQDVREGQARIEERLRSIDDGLKRVQRILEGQ